MADGQASPPETESHALSLADIRADIRALTSTTVTKSDLKSTSDTLHEAIRAEVAMLGNDIAAQGNHIHSLEQAMTGRIEANNLAINQQGIILLHLRLQAEDLDNRGRRSNIRVRNLPESNGEENVETTLTTLFKEILGPDAPPNIRFDRAHRATRSRNIDNSPRDIVCCLHKFKLKELIMSKARSKQSWPFQGAENYGLAHWHKELHDAAEKTHRVDCLHTDPATRRSKPNERDTNATSYLETPSTGSTGTPSGLRPTQISTFYPIPTCTDLWPKTADPSHLRLPSPLDTTEMTNPP
ncbi:Hypothetical predicted protein [Pelobates cultripes]|uniref:Uncharacterized protein n=1 Tax=Pelobates cultripes TaxID=61616 RepID=A0AAD1VQF2_PELCU|nr:Hypothetical predicted protein [Pelobates cultripes]